MPVRSGTGSGDLPIESFFVMPIEQAENAHSVNFDIQTADQSGDGAEDQDKTAAF